MKVLVIGGSVSGLFSSLFILSSNLEADLTLIERKRSIGEGIICAGGISSYMLKKARVSIPKEFIASKIKRIRFYSPSMNFSEVYFPTEYGLILYRDKWERWLGSQVEELGGKVKTGYEIKPAELKKYDLIVGADGISGFTRKFAKTKQPLKSDVHLAIQAEYRLKHPADAISIFLGSQIAKHGYGWIFPCGDICRVGLGVPLTHSKMVFKFFKRFTSELEHLGLSPKLVGKPKLKLIPTSKPPASNLRGKIAFVGDAGLLTDPSSGAGIPSAMISARCLAEALNRGNLKLYDELWKKEFYRRNMLRYEFKQILYELSDGEYELLIKSLDGFKPIGGSMSVTIAHALLRLAIENPAIMVRHKILRRLAKTLALKMQQV